MKLGSHTPEQLAKELVRLRDATRDAGIDLRQARDKAKEKEEALKATREELTDGLARYMLAFPLDVVYQAFERAKAAREEEERRRQLEKDAKARQSTEPAPRAD